MSTPTSAEIAASLAPAIRSALEIRRDELLGEVDPLPLRLAARTFWPVLMLWVPTLTQVAIRALAGYLKGKTIDDLWRTLEGVAAETR